MNRTEHVAQPPSAVSDPDPGGGRARSVWADQSGATMVETALLLAGIGIPSYYLFRLALWILLGHYEMITFLNGWPFP